MLSSPRVVGKPCSSSPTRLCLVRHARYIHFLFIFSHLSEREQQATG